jgi:asparagine synthase (glutamine-hydrolysing)
VAGIAGIVNLGNEPVQPQTIAAMFEALRYRGPDGSDSRHDDGVGFAHAHFWTTPEEVGERQPLVARSGRHWVTADARIDNRDDLLRVLRGRGYVDESTPSDAEIISAAYECWGEDAVKRLVGDFAFAIWDFAEQRLLLARDALGMRPLFYAVVDGRVHFASTVAAVVAALPKVPALNTPLIRDLLCNSFRPLIWQTVYRGVYRLPPAHLMVARRASISRRIYYRLGQEEKPRHSSDVAWLDDFRHLLEEAVRCRLRATTPVAILGSGGVDSASVACLAQKLAEKDPGCPKVGIYAAVFDETPEADERQYLTILEAACPLLSSHHVGGDDLWALREFGTDRGFPLDEPEVVTTRALPLALLRQASNDGCRVALTGEGSNDALGGAYYRPGALRGVPLRHLLSEARHFRDHAQLGWAALLVRGFLAPKVPAKVKAILRRWTGRERGCPKWVKRPPHGTEDLHIGPDPRFFDPPSLSPAARVSHSQVRSGFNLTRLSHLEKAAAQLEVDLRHPFFDRRLVECALHLPHHLLSWNRLDRVALRESMRNVLPEAIRTRWSKAHILGLFDRGLWKMERSRIAALLASPMLEELGLVDSKRVAEAFDAFRHRSGDYRMLNYLIDYLCIEEWVRGTCGRDGEAKHNE